MNFFKLWFFLLQNLLENTVTLITSKGKSWTGSKIRMAVPKLSPQEKKKLYAHGLPWKSANSFMEQLILTRNRKGIVIRLREATQLLWATDVDLEGGLGGLGALLFPTECVSGAILALQIQILKTMLLLVGTLKLPRASYTEFEVRSLCRKGEKK